MTAEQSADEASPADQPKSGDEPKPADEPKSADKLKTVAVSLDLATNRFIARGGHGATRS